MSEQFQILSVLSSSIVTLAWVSNSAAFLTWIIDSWASNHMTRNKNIVSSFNSMWSFSSVDDSTSLRHRNCWCYIFSICIVCT